MICTKILTPLKFNSFRNLSSLFLLIIIFSCKTTYKTENKLKDHFREMKFNTYNASKDGSLTNLDTENMLKGEGISVVDGKRTAYKYAVTIDKKGNFSDFYYGTDGQDGGKVVFMSQDDARDKLKKCSADNAGNPPSELFACMDAVINKAISDCDAAKQSGVDVDVHCW
jgi:hypothetical protein